MSNQSSFVRRRQGAWASWCLSLAIGWGAGGAHGEEPLPLPRPLPPSEPTGARTVGSVSPYHPMFPDTNFTSSPSANSCDSGTTNGAPTKSQTATPLVPAGPSPSGPDIQVMPIDLPSALRLANTSNPTIGVARARVEEAYYRLRETEVLWLPNLQTGPVYNRHDGFTQSSHGDVFSVSKWNFFIGGGAAFSVDTSDALFAPLIARRLVQAQEAAAQAVTYDIQLQAALAYLELWRAYGALAINADILVKAEEMLRIAKSVEAAGFGKTPADANRARAEVESRRVERIDLEGQAAVASARLAQLLLLDPTLDLRPTDPAIVPITLVPCGGPLEELVATGLMNRPELAESRSLVAAALERWRQRKVGPLLPRLEVDYAAGDFGGGINDSTQTFGGRGDVLAQAVWTLHNFGAGDIARARESRSQYNAANFHVLEVEAQVGADVTAAAKLARSHQRTLDSAQEAVRQAEETWRRILIWTKGVGFRIRRIESLDLLIAEQNLALIRQRYLAEVIDFNQAQFRLYWAMGQPPLCALPQATAVPPVQVPVTPAPDAMPRVEVESKKQ